MTEHLPRGASHAPSSARNRSHILAALRPHVPAEGSVLEIASGTGEHAVYCASHLPRVQWRPSDASADALESIAAWRLHASLANLSPPIALDVTVAAQWPAEHVDAVVCINMIHIAPWAATLGLMAGAAKVLAPTGILYLYGPYFEPDVEPAPSNRAFDLSLRQRNAAWGIRPLDDVVAAAATQGLALSARISMPAHNLSLVFRKT